MRLYQCCCIEGNDDETKKSFINLLKMEDEIKEKVPEKYHEDAIVYLHNDIRKYLKEPELKNKLLVLIELENHEVVIMFFDKEPDGKCHDIHYDKEKNSFYIEVEDSIS